MKPGSYGPNTGLGCRVLRFRVDGLGFYGLGCEVLRFRAVTCSGVGLNATYKDLVK